MGVGRGWRASAWLPWGYRELARGWLHSTMSMLLVERKHAAGYESIKEPLTSCLLLVQRKVHGSTHGGQEGKGAGV